jgi:galactokinase
VRAFWAPGRVNLIGEHTDYTGGLVLPAAIDLGIRIECEAAERIRLESDVYEGVVDLDARGEEGEGWGRFAGAVALELDALGRPPVGLAGRVGSNLPIGAGLSSSAALEIAIGIALCAVAGFELEPMALAQAAQRAELRAVGVPCGIMDQAACVLGVEGHVILLDTGTLEHRAVPLPGELAVVVVDSGVRHTLADSGYAERRREVEAGVERRWRHIRGENERVQAVVAALEAGEAERLGPLFRAGHESLRDDFEVSTPELDLLVDRAYELGAVAARKNGGGVGGSIVALVSGATRRRRSPPRSPSHCRPRTASSRAPPVARTSSSRRDRARSAPARSRAGAAPSRSRAASRARRARRAPRRPGTPRPSARGSARSCRCPRPRR